MDMMDFDYQPEETVPQESSRSARSGGSSGGSFGVADLTQGSLRAVLIGAALGLLVGLVFAWWIWPVQWTNAAVGDLRVDLQDDYILMVVDSYNLEQDWELAKRRIDEMGAAGPAALTRAAGQATDPARLATIDLFRQVIGTEGETTESGEPPAAGGESGTGSLLLVACGITAVLAVILVAMYFFRSRQRGPVEKTAAMRAQEYSRAAEQTDFEAIGADTPVAQWMTTYLVGDDLFDDSFSIDSPSGEFLGECGVGIADTIGVGEPKRVSAFEVWLFDKNDIQTVTKVMMSGHIYNDEASHNRLAAKGEPILAKPGAEGVLETQTLQMVVRVVDMAYGGGALPEHSFFERVTLELAVWNK